MQLGTVEKWGGRTRIGFVFDATEKTGPMHSIGFHVLDFLEQQPDWPDKRRQCRQ